MVKNYRIAESYDETEKTGTYMEVEQFFFIFFFLHDLLQSVFYSADVYKNLLRVSLLTKSFL